MKKKTPKSSPIVTLPSYTDNFNSKYLSVVQNLKKINNQETLTGERLERALGETAEEVKSIFIRIAKAEKDLNEINSKTKSLESLTVLGFFALLIVVIGIAYSYYEFAYSNRVTEEKKTEILNSNKALQEEISKYKTNTNKCINASYNFYQLKSCFQLLNQ